MNFAARVAAASAFALRTLAYRQLHGGPAFRPHRDATPTTSDLGCVSAERGFSQHPFSENPMAGHTTLS